MNNSMGRNKLITDHSGGYYNDTGGSVSDDLLATRLIFS
jgi:hypothetical protein